VFAKSLTPRLTGAGGPTGPQGTNTGHENGEAMASVGVRVEPTVRLRREVEGLKSTHGLACGVLHFACQPALVTDAANVELLISICLQCQFKWHSLATLPLG